MPGYEEPCEPNEEMQTLPWQSRETPGNVTCRGVTGSEAPHDGSERPLRWQPVPVTSSTTVSLSSSLLMEPELG